MKLMKKVIFTLLALLVGATVSVAQNVTPRAEIGLNVANVKMAGDAKPDAKLGLRIGGAVEIGLADGVYLAPGLMYRANGFSGDASTSATFHYLSLPVNLGYRFTLAPEWGLSLEAGPYLAYGLGGDIKSAFGKVDAFGDHGDLKRFEAGLGMSVGIDYGRYFARIGTDLGLTNSAKQGSVKNTDFYIGLGLRF